MRQVYRPGETAPFNGIYLAAKFGEPLPSTRVFLVQGQVFPARLGWLFILVEPGRPTLTLLEPPPDDDAASEAL